MWQREAVALNAMVLVAGNDSTAITHIVPDNSGNPSLVGCLARGRAKTDPARQVQDAAGQVHGAETQQACETTNCISNAEAPSRSAPVIAARCTGTMWMMSLLRS